MQIPRKLNSKPRAKILTERCEHSKCVVGVIAGAHKERL